MLQTIFANPSVVIVFVSAFIGYNFSLVCKEKIRSDIKMNESRKRIEDEKLLSMIRTDEAKTLSMIKTDEAKTLTMINTDETRTLSMIRADETKTLSMIRADEEKRRRSD